MVCCSDGTPMWVVRDSSIAGSGPEGARLMIPVLGADESLSGVSGEARVAHTYGE